MFSDSPVTDSSQDRFNRLPFSKRVADALSARIDPTSIVIGIYGAWGEGKSTVLNFIEASLKNEPNVICIRFNPWLFKSEDQLIRNFFGVLADKLDRSISNRKEKIGDFLSKYSAYLAPVDVGLSLFKIPAPSDALKKLGGALSGIELEQIKERIETFLADSQKRVIILMDDIDRLDKIEIQSVFKLVKLSADFKYTAYVLAFDEEMVAAAISERYGSGDKEAGRSFLEKIVQVPLTLPASGELALRRYCLECVDEALKGLGTELTEDEVRRFVRYFTSGLEIQLKTPRMAKRYGNTLSFSLPLLRGEINIVDLMLIEGVKVLYPELYTVIKSNPDFFLGNLIDKYKDNNQLKEISNKILQKGLSNLESDVQEAAKSLVVELFPRLNGILGNSHYGSDWQERWTKEKRISSIDYFSRYFSYSIPEGDISDQFLEEFLLKIETESPLNIYSDIQKVIGKQGENTEAFLVRVRRRERKLSQRASKNLALAISYSGDSFPKPETLYSFTTPFSQAGILVSRLLENLPQAEDRFDLARTILLEGKPVAFACECFTWMFRTKEGSEIFTQDQEADLAQIIVSRIKKLAFEEPLYNQQPHYARQLFSIWARKGSREETNSYLKEMFEQDPHEVLNFLKYYIPTSWSMGSGLPFKSSIERNDYDAISAIVDAEIVIQHLRAIYGSDLDSPQYYEDEERPLEERAAHQFAYINNEVHKEIQARVEGEGNAENHPDSEQ